MKTNRVALLILRERVPNRYLRMGISPRMGRVLTEASKERVVNPPTTMVYPSGMVTELSTEFFWLGGGRPLEAAPVKLLNSML